MGGAIALTLIMAVAPSGLAARSHSTLLSPYSGTTSSSGSYLDQTCGKATATAAKWKSTTGVATGSSASSFTSCTYVGSNAYGESESYEYVAFPFTVSKTAYYNATMGLTWKDYAASAVTTSACPKALNYSTGYDENECEWDASWYIDAGLWIVDTTTGYTMSESDNSWQVGNYSGAYAENYCDKGKCTSSSGSYVGSSAYDFAYQAPGYDYVDLYAPFGTSSGVGSLWTNSTSWNGYSGANQTLVATDSYEVVALFEFGTFATEYGYQDIYTGSVYKFINFNPGGSGSASLDAKPSAYGLTVSSITIAAVS